MKHKEELYLTLSDVELCQQAQRGEQDAMELLCKRYSCLVKSCARPYFLVGADEEDLLQEGMLGLLNAIREFDSQKGIPFPAFARVCVLRRIYSAVRTASAMKHSPLNRSMSFDRPLFEDLAESHNRIMISSSDPESLVIGNEERDERMKQLYALLSAFEAKVLTLFLDGLSYEQMAETLHKPVKSVDNAIQRIRRKSATISNPK